MRYLGTMNIPGNESRDNSTTVSPFSLPKNPCSLILVPSATGLVVRFGAQASVTADDWPLTDQTYQFPYAGRETGLVALKNTTGGALTCKVYATDVSGILVRG